MKKAVCLLLAVSTLSTFGCVRSLPHTAKLLAARQECGGADLIARNPALTNLYEHAMDAQEAAYERGQADVVAGLSKAVGSAAR